MKVTSTEFQQNVGRYQDAALQSPVAITKNGRPPHGADVGRRLRADAQGADRTPGRRPG